MARDQFDPAGRNLSPEWEGHYHTGRECICNDVAPEPRDEAPRWRWEPNPDPKLDLVWELVDPKGEQTIWTTNEDAMLRQRVVDTLNAGERAREDVERLTYERDEFKRAFVERTESYSTTLPRLHAERDALQQQLRDLLAIIHRDGGHYTEEHGLEKSFADAHLVWAALQARVRELEGNAALAYRDMLAVSDALGTSGARPYSMHEHVQRDIIPQIARLRDE